MTAKPGLCGTIAYMPVDDPLLSKVAEWVETSGRALELRTARALLGGAPLTVHQSLGFEDPDTGKQREGDVVGTYRWLWGHHSVALEVAVECKSSKDHPWVAFYDHRTEKEPASRTSLTFGGRWPASARVSLAEVWAEQEELVVTRVATHAAEGMGKDGRNVVLDAARQAVSFGRARAKSNYRHLGDPDELTPLTVVVPTVVTQAPLFTCELSEDGQVNLNRVDKFDLHVGRGVRLGGRVYVRTEESFARMAKAFDAIQDHLGAFRPNESTSVE